MSMLSGEAVAQMHGDCWVNEGSPNNCFVGGLATLACYSSNKSAVKYVLPRRTNGGLQCCAGLW
jgi:hypothetical protein